MTSGSRQPGDTAAPMRPERVRVALVSASRPDSDDFHELLRRRLLVLSLFLAGTIAFILAVAFVVSPPSTQSLSENWQAFAVLAANAIAVVLLTRGRSLSMRRLRLCELLILGPIVAAILASNVSEYSYQDLERAQQETGDYRAALIARYVNGSRFGWFMIITIYGALIPNTLRRAAIVTGSMAVAPLVLFAVYAYGVRPLEPEIAGGVLAAEGIFHAIAVIAVLFSTSRIEVLRRQANEARKLGQYRLAERLGAGGMGEVYRAEHRLLRRPCAIKTIRPEQAGDVDTLRRFEREVQITATLTHPNTVQVYDYGHADDGTFYYVMEYLPGLTLEQLVRRYGPLPPDRTVRFLRQIVAALGEAHALGLTHRDIKPGNVMVRRRGGVHDVAKLLDFGLVSVPKEGADGATMTREGTIAGTPAYMSPEQAGGQAVLDARSDLYSVGAVAYFLDRSASVREPHGDSHAGGSSLRTARTAPRLRSERSRGDRDALFGEVAGRAVA